MGSQIEPRRQLERRWGSRAAAGGVATGAVMAVVVHAVVGTAFLPALADLGLAVALGALVVRTEGILRRMSALAVGGVVAVGMLGMLIWALL